MWIEQNGVKMGSKQEKIFSRPSFRHGTILSKLPESVKIQALVNVQECIMGEIWDPILHDLTDLFEENEVTAADMDINSCKPEKRGYEGPGVRLPHIPIHYRDFDVNLRVALTLCLSSNHPKIWSSFSMISYEGKNEGLDSGTAKKFFEYFLPLAREIAAVKIHYYIESMKAEGLDVEGSIEHSFDIRTVGIKNEEVKKVLAPLSSQRSAYIDEVVRDPLKFGMFEECFKYLPPEIAITKERKRWFGLSTMIGDEMADFLYHETSTNNGKSNTYLTGVCPDLGHEGNAPAIGSGILMGGISRNT